jgi:hypothetical protein
LGPALSLYAPGMTFTVYIDDGGGDGAYEYGRYRGASSYTLADSGALVVRPEGGGRVTFGPAGWSRVEEDSGRVEEDSEGGSDYDVDDSIG